ncbi:MAG: hypothetical protein O7A07_10485 [Acidobacteria bacterium]|nr:hypothetical protein [Acidobacteriota bacterium]
MPQPSGHISIRGWVLATLLVASSWAFPATAETGPPEVPPGLAAQALIQHADSGAPGDAEPAWNTVVGDEYADWVRVFFGSETQLPPEASIRLTSLQDGAQQSLSAETLAQWQNSSAYFNGPEVLVELISPPGGDGGRVVVVGLWAGVSVYVTESICFSDGRILSSDARAARLLFQGCTGWLLNECLVTAGHCMAGNNVVQFNVPLSSVFGVVNHPPPSDQYSVDTGSQQFFDPGIGVPPGDDWAYFGVFPNSQTGLTPLQAQGAHYVLASNTPAAVNQSLRLTGYGVDSTPSENSQVQQTEAGPLHDFFETTLAYQVDTTGGSSGSAVEEEGSQRVIGIHTNAGCTASGGDNFGTAINHFGFQDALRNPVGVCASQAACNNDGVCDPGEDCFNCINDCVYQSPAAFCGDGTCNIIDGEDCRSCPDDCNKATSGPPSSRPCCGEDVGCEDPLCTGDGNVCSSVPVNGTGYCCGDGLCQNAENDTNCTVDCGTCFATQEVMNLRIEPVLSFFRFSWDATSDPCLISYVLLGNNDPSSSVYNIVARSGPATFWLGNPLFSYYLVVVEDEVGGFGPLGHYGQ